jgi:hypothetical protein
VVFPGKEWTNHIETRTNLPYPPKIIDDSALSEKMQQFLFFLNLHKKQPFEQLRITLSRSVIPDMTDPRPTLSPRPLDGGIGWYVQVDWLDFSDRVGAFVSRDEAEDWIEHKSEDWLRQYQRPPKRR